ncbi:hypothetical protein [Comamonas flocculans]|uniref:Uncharacterized protein n=1 Tax=Comamonas flocculans TaxID=2597701 RepID=A0A5B8RV31_9BURK|nr:hypothetical protein [Comamonas flocculans]QEA12095.1 hypothetical protein FOZ74_03035 [Comamonas flocculans]
MTNFDSNAIELVHPATGQRRQLASWRTPRNGAHAQFWEPVSLALAHVGNLADSLATIRNNERLSDGAKLEDSKNVVVRTLRELGQVQVKLNAAIEAVGVERGKLSAAQPYSPTDAVTVQIDLALAAHLRSLAGPERERFVAGLHDGTNQRAVDAVLRLPPVLTSLSNELLGLIEVRAIERANPDQVREFQELAQSARRAQEILREASAAVTQAAQLTPQEIYQSFGTAGGDWARLAGVMTSDPEAIGVLERRYQAADASQGVE